MRSYIDWRGEQNILYKGVETSPFFKNLEGKSGRESLKRTISASGGLGLLQFYLHVITVILF